MPAEFAPKRQAIIKASGKLQERELIKLASLADALHSRGVADPAAGLTGEVLGRKGQPTGPGSFSVRRRSTK